MLGIGRLNQAQEDVNKRSIRDNRGDGAIRSDKKQNWVFITLVLGRRDRKMLMVHFDLVLLEECLGLVHETTLYDSFHQLEFLCYQGFQQSHG